jgi:RHS repeat-associated protein
VSSAGVWNRGEVYAGSRHLATYSGGASGVTYFATADWLGTERMRTGVSGPIVETCTSQPFGDAQTCTGSEVSPMHFTGQHFDSESYLSHMEFRSLSPTQGRWTSMDPARMAAAGPENPQSWNLYAYVLNNPARSIDPTGLTPGWSTSGQIGSSDGYCDVEYTSCETPSFEEVGVERGLIASLGWRTNPIIPGIDVWWFTSQEIEEIPTAPPDVQRDIDGGVPPSANMINCPNCKYYPSDVRKAVTTHEREHLKQLLVMGGVEGAVCSAIKSCHRLMELEAYWAESKFVDTRLSELSAEQTKGGLSPQDQISQRVLMQMKVQEDTFFEIPSLLDDY